MELNAASLLQLVPKRRLMERALTVVNATELASLLVTRVVVSTAVACCHESQSCHVPAWSVALIALGGSVVALLLVALLFAAVFVKRTRARRAAAASSPTY